jgi:hypothetical protein
MTNFCKILKFPNITGLNLSTERCIAKIGGYELWHIGTLYLYLYFYSETNLCFLAHAHAFLLRKMN